MNTGSRLDLLSLFILAVASLLLPILGFLGGAVLVHQTKAYKSQDELVALAAIPVFAFVFVMAVEWPDDPSFSETMTALADTLATATAFGGVIGAAYLWSRQGQRAAAARMAEQRAQPRRPQQPQAAQRAQAAPSAPKRPAPTVQPAGERPPDQRPTGIPRSPRSPRPPAESGTLSQWFPPRRPR
jgi:hypothetical protein